LIAGNIYCVIAIAVWISDSNMLIFSCVFILLVFLVAGALSAMTHKQSPAYFRIRQAIVDGFCGGFVSSILLAIGLLLLFNLSVTNQLMNFVFGLFVAFLCLSIAGFVGGIGGWAWGLFYAIFLSKRRS